MGQMDFCIDGRIVRWKEAECQAEVWPGKSLQEITCIQTSLSEASPSPSSQGTSGCSARGGTRWATTPPLTRQVSSPDQGAAKSEAILCPR